MPWLALVEPEWTLAKNHSHRSDTKEKIVATYRDLGRNQRRGARGLQLITDLGQFLTSSDQDEDRLSRQMNQRILDHATVLSADSDTLRVAMAAMRTYNLRFFDAIMFASVRRDLSSHTGLLSYFLNRNKRDFCTPELLAEFNDLGCKLLTSFRGGLSLINAKLRQ